MPVQHLLITNLTLHLCVHMHACVPMWGYKYLLHRPPNAQVSEKGLCISSYPISCFYSKGKEGPQRESDLPQATKVVSGHNEDIQFPAPDPASVSILQTRGTFLPDLSWTSIQR